MTRIVGGWAIGVLMCLCVVVGVGHYSPAQKQANVDRCLASAVRTYPTLGGRDMEVAKLKDCEGLSDDEVARVRTELQAFGTEALSRAAGQ